MNQANRNVEQLQNKIASLQEELVMARQENDRYRLALVEAEGKYEVEKKERRALKQEISEFLDMLWGIVERGERVNEMSAQARIHRIKGLCQR